MDTYCNVCRTLCTQNIQVMIHAIVLLAVVALPLLGDASATSYIPCDNDDNCDRIRGEVCWQLFNGCSQGVCMCNPDNQVADRITRECRYFRYGNEHCTDSDTCLNDMVCRNNSCQCPRGEMTPESNFCMYPRHKMLGETCNPSANDICLQKSDTGYSDVGLQCHNRRCRCRSGFQQEGMQCKNPEGGAICKTTYDCEGGFICVRELCRCPSNYRAIAKNTKCANVNAIIDLPVGAYCDEVNEKNYCASGLVCHVCQNENQHKCLRYSISSADPEYSEHSASGSFNQWSATSLLVTLTTHLVIYSSR